MKYFGSKMLVATMMLSALCLGFVSSSNLTTLQDATIQKLEGIEQRVDTVLDSVERRTMNSELQASIAQNQEEIDELVDQQSQAIKDATSPEQIQEIVLDTAKRVILKTYDGVTDKDSLEETVNVDGSQEEKREAITVAKESMVGNGTYTVQLTAKGRYEDAMKKLRLFDPLLKGTLLFEDGIKTTLQITVQEDSLFSQEVLGGLSEGEVPDGLIGFSVHKPEVYRIEAIDLGNEGLQNARGVTEYGTYRYREGMNKTTVTVGVVDTGVDMQHPDLKDRISTTIRGYDFVNNDADPTDDHYHGTHVAGTIAASNNGAGIIGVNPYVEIVPLKICTAKGYCPSYAITNALKYAADQGIDILNMSLGGRGTVANNPTCEAIEYAVSKGVIPVVAAGNANSPVEYSIPGGCPQTLTVGAYDSSQIRANFSNYGVGVDVSAPGVDVYSTIPGGYKKTSGTSMATPHVAGLVSILLSQNTTLTLQQIKKLLTSHPVVLQTESSKPIGVGVDVQALLHAQGLQSQEVTCNEIACVFGNGEHAIQTEGESQDSTGISVSAEVFEIEVGQTKALVVGGGEGTYRIRKDNENVGFLDGSQGVGIASAGETKEIQIEQGTEEYNELDESYEDSDQVHDEREDELPENEEGEEMQFDESLFSHEESVGIASSIASTTINLLGLVPGNSTITIVDQSGVEKTIQVQIKETVFWLQPNGWAQIRPKQGRAVAKRGSHTYPRDLLDRFSYYRGGSFKINASRYADGEGVMKRTVYNWYERKYQSMQWTLRVSQTKERAQLEIGGVDETVTMRVGDVRTVNVSGGVPMYSMSHSTNAVRVDKPKNISSSRYKVNMRAWRGIGIASADEGEEEAIPMMVYEDEMGEEGELQSDMSGEEGTEEEYFGEELTFGQVAELQEEEGGTITIASAAATYPVEIYAVNPGESTVQVVDAQGETRTIQVIVQEKVTEARMGDRFRWYYRAHNSQPFHVAYIQSSNQDIIRTSYRRRNYYAQVIQPGKAVVTIGIAARKNGRAYTTMQFTVLARSNQPLQVSQEAITVPVGAWSDITLQGGLPIYLVSKSNENVGLGNSNATQAIGVAGNSSVQPPVLEYRLVSQGTDEYIPTVEELPQQSENIIPILDGVEAEYEEEVIVDEVITPASAQVIQAKPNVLSIIGLIPGTSEVTVKDQLGDTKVITVTVTEPDPQTIKTSLKLRFIESEHEYGERRNFIDQGLYFKASRPYVMQRMSSSSSMIYNAYFRKFRGWYGAGGIGGEAIVTTHIYLPLEKKQAKYSYMVNVLGPTVEEVKENWRLWQIRKRENNGQRSSITSGEGTYSGENSEESSESTSQSGLDHFEKREYIVSVGESIDIPLLHRDDSYKLRLKNQKLLYLGSDSGVSVSAEEQIDVAYDTGSEEVEWSLSVAGTTQDKVITLGGAQSGESSLQVYTPMKKEEVSVKVIDKTYTLPIGKGYVPFGGKLDIRSVGSTNEEVLKIFKAGVGEDQGLMYNAFKEGKTVLSLEVYNRITKSIQSVKIHIKVVGENYSDNQITEITREISLKPGNSYELYLYNKGKYEVSIEGSINIKGSTSYGLEVQSVGSKLSAGLRYVGTLLDGQESINVNLDISAFRNTTIYIKSNEINYKIIVKPEIKGEEKFSDDEYGIYLRKKSKLTIEEYIYKFFIDTGIKIENQTTVQSLLDFSKNFGDKGDWNFKNIIHNSGYSVDKDGFIILNGREVHSSALGNILFGFLSNIGGFYEYAKNEATIREHENYSQYYGDELGYLRMQVNENEDLIYYKIGNELTKSNVLDRHNGFIDEMIQKVNNLESDIVEAKSNEEDALMEICNETNGSYHGGEAASRACHTRINNYHILNDKGEKIYFGDK